MPEFEISDEPSKFDIPEKCTRCLPLSELSTKFLLASRKEHKAARYGQLAMAELPERFRSALYERLSRSPSDSFSSVNSTVSKKIASEEAGWRRRCGFLLEIAAQEVENIEKQGNEMTSHCDGAVTTIVIRNGIEYDVSFCGSTQPNAFSDRAIITRHRVDE